MLGRLKAKIERLAALEPGERFEAFHRQQQDSSRALKAAFLGVAVLSLGVGGVLAFIPGPAFVFFGLSAALLAAQSLTVARWLDQGEVWGRKAFASIRRWWRRRRSGRT